MFAIISEMTGANIDILMISTATLLLAVHFRYLAPLLDD